MYWVKLFFNVFNISGEIKIFCYWSRLKNYTNFLWEPSYVRKSILLKITCNSLIFGASSFSSEIAFWSTDDQPFQSGESMKLYQPWKFPSLVSLPLPPQRGQSQEGDGRAIYWHLKYSRHGSMSNHTLDWKQFTETFSNEQKVNYLFSWKFAASASSQRCAGCQKCQARPDIRHRSKLL